MLLGRPIPPPRSGPELWRRRKLSRKIASPVTLAHQSHWQHTTTTHPHHYPPFSAPSTDDMASKHASRALRASLRQATAPRVQQRTFVSAVNAASRPMVQQAAPASFVQQTRGAKTVDFAGDKEKVFGRA